MVIIRKTIFIFIIFSLGFSSFAQCKLKNNEIKKVKIYLVEWNINTKLPYTIKNFKKFYRYYFEINKCDFDDLFFDYAECIEMLSSQKSISSDTAASNFVRDYVEIRFLKGKKVKLYFDIIGNYYFKNKWYSRNDSLYYALFKYFSDLLIPQKIISQAKINFLKGQIK